MPKLGKKKQFLIDHPYCCFCGGTSKSTTTDHVPPQACFPDGYFPEGFEFPACEQCNHATKKDDQVFGFYSQLMDFDDANRTPAETAKMQKLLKGIRNNYPAALPNTATARPVYHDGLIATSSPLAVQVKTPPEVFQAIRSAGRKLTHALYYRENGEALTTQQKFASAAYQIQGSPVTLTRFFAELLPGEAHGRRSNIRRYGERFGYKFGLKKEEGFFLYAAQFGRGLIIWGMVLGPSMKVEDLGEHLRGYPWYQAGSGGVMATATASGE